MYLVLSGAAMIPFGDETQQTEHFPVVTAVIIAVNLTVFLPEISNVDAIVTRWSVVPHELTAGHHVETLLAAIFMHAGWLHIMGNTIFLWAFGPQIENAMNPLR